MGASNVPITNCVLVGLVDVCHVVCDDVAGCCHDATDQGAAATAAGDMDG